MFCKKTISIPYAPEGENCTLKHIGRFNDYSPIYLNVGSTLFRPHSSNYKSMDFIFANYQNNPLSCKVMFIQTSIQDPLEKIKELHCTLENADDILNSNTFDSWFSVLHDNAITPNNVKFDFWLLHAAPLILFALKISL